MSDWLGYSLRDFLMFGPEVYWRLFSLHNQALWPLPAVALAAGIGVLLLLAYSDRPLRPTIGLALGLGWAGATHFLATRYAPINWPLDYAVWAFGAQAVMAALSINSRALDAARPVSGMARRIGLGLVAYSVLLHPLIGLGFGRPLAQAEIIGLAPDPTVIASLGLLLLMGRSWWRAALSVIPVIWCVVSAVTLLALGEAQGWVLLGALGIWTAGLLAQMPRGSRGDRPDQGAD